MDKGKESIRKEGEKLLDIAHRIEKGGKRKVTVLGKTFTISDTKRSVLNKIYDIQFKLKYFEGKESFKSLRSRVKYINSTDAMIASLILLNELSYIPFLHAIHWRWINAKYTTETLSAIIEVGLNDEESSFFLKNSLLGRELMEIRLVTIAGE